MPCKSIYFAAYSDVLLARRGLASTMVFVPIMSVGALQPMVHLEELTKEPDYMLVEWIAALELQQRGKLKAVLPIFVAAKNNFFAEANAAFGGVSGLPDRVPKATIERVLFHLEETTNDSSIEKLRKLMGETTAVEREATIRRVVEALLKFQGCKYSYAEANMEPCVSSLHGLLSGCLHRVAMAAGKEKLPLPLDHQMQAFADGEL